VTALSLSLVIDILIRTLVAFIALVIVDAILTKELSAKRTFAMAFLALFIVPIAASFIALPSILGSGLVSLIILPLIVWIILGEVMLKAEWKTKLKVAVIAFIVYLVLIFVNLGSYLRAILPF